MKSFAARWLLAALIAAFAASTQAQLLARADEQPRQIQVGPVNVVQQVQGVSVIVPMSVRLSVRAEPSEYYLDALVDGDLLDLQRKVPKIIDAISLPTNNCLGYKSDNLVIQIPAKRLIPAGAEAQLVLDGSVDIWSCFENPIPNTSVEWITDGPFGIKRPKVVTSKAAPIRSKLFTQSLHATVAIVPSIVDPFTAGVNITEPNPSFGKEDSPLANGLITSARSDIIMQAAKLMSNAIDPNRQQTIVPSDYRILRPVLQFVGFKDDSDRLILTMSMSATMPLPKINELFSSLQRNAGYSIFAHYRPSVPVSVAYAATVRTVLGAEAFIVREDSPDSKVTSIAGDGGQNVEGGPHVTYFIDPEKSRQEQDEIANLAERVAELLNEKRPKEFGPLKPWRNTDRQHAPNQTHVLAVWF